MTILVAIMLAGSKVVLSPIAKVNEDIFNKRQILEAIAKPLEEAGKPLAELSDKEVLAIFDEQIEEQVIAMDGTLQEGMKATEVDMAKQAKEPEDQRVLPVYKVNFGNTNYYIFSVRGNGLWDAIWGNIALEDDMNTIAGVSFDHAGETPGLGAEIKDNAKWKSQFVGKKIYKGDQYVSVLVRKGGALDKEHEVDGLSGATVTADGVTKMLYTGLKAYEPYMEEAGKGSSSLLID